MERDKHVVERTRRKKKKNRWTNYIIIGVVLGVYLLARSIGGGYQTVSAVHVTEEDSFAATGWFMRDEVAVSGGTSSTVKHIVYSGERVQQNAPLAVLYRDEQSLAQSRQLAALNEQIALLDSALQGSGDTADAAKLDQLIVVSLQQLAEQLKTGSGAALGNSTTALRSLSLKRAAGTVEDGSIEAERDALQAERAALEQQLSGSSSEIAAPSSGYFSEIVDGYESVLTVDGLDKLTLEEFSERIKSPQKSEGLPLGKIVQGFQWYLGIEISAERASALKEGQSLHVRFSNASLETPASIFAINKERGADKALLILTGNDFGSEIVSMRSQPIEVILGTYTGLKVPKAAVRMVGDEGEEQSRGVYILSGSVMRAKRIKPLFENDTYYVVEQSATDAGALVAQDKIVVSGKGLQNNMVVKS